MSLGVASLRIVSRELQVGSLWLASCKLQVCGWRGCKFATRELQVCYLRIAICEFASRELHKQPNNQTKRTTAKVTYSL